MKLLPVISVRMYMSAPHIDVAPDGWPTPRDSPVYGAGFGNSQCISLTTPYSKTRALSTGVMC